MSLYYKGVFHHVRDVPVLRLHVAPTSQSARQLRFIGQSLHLLCEGVGIAMGEEQAVSLVMHVLGHASVVGGYHGDPGLQRLVNDEGRILRPDRRHDEWRRSG